MTVSCEKYFLKIKIIDRALKLKDEGNLLFRESKYKNAVVSYTKALKEKIDDDKELMSILHQNRAAAHFQMENYRSALNDCAFAYKFNPKNIKCVYKAIESCLALKKYSDVLNWCEMGFKISF